MNKKFRFFEDNGHGWLEVNKSELKTLGIEGKISSYSYQKGDFAYLEEDCDASIFADAWEEANNQNFNSQVLYQICNGSSEIHNYQSYKGAL